MVTGGSGANGLRNKTVLFENTNERILLFIIGEKGLVKEVEQVRS